MEEWEVQILGPGKKGALAGLEAWEAGGVTNEVSTGRAGHE